MRAQVLLPQLLDKRVPGLHRYLFQVALKSLGACWPIELGLDFEHDRVYEFGGELGCCAERSNAAARASVETCMPLANSPQARLVL